MNESNFYLIPDNELYHHGIKGMKWGIRRYQNKDGSLIKSGKKKSHLSSVSKLMKQHKEKTSARKAYKKSMTKPTKRSLSDMSNEELKAKIDRMDLEIKYKSKYKELHPDKVSKGKKFLNTISDVTTSSLEKAGKNIGGQLATYIVGEITNKAAGKEIVNPKKGQKDK